ncbi:MAG: GNAT family N-acetyltransferase [Pseudolabrys sp.]
MIRRAEDEDAAAIADTWNEAISEGKSLYWRSPVSQESVLRLISSESAFRVEEEDKLVRGFYLLHANAPDRDSHIANAMYVVRRACRGLGIGRLLAEGSLSLAAELGFRAMQFNSVVESNTASVSLWRSLGFVEIGRVPGAFKFDSGEAVDVLIFYRGLGRQ